jgi:hypothetical protein
MTFNDLNFATLDPFDSQSVSIALQHHSNVSLLARFFPWDFSTSTRTSIDPVTDPNLTWFSALPYAIDPIASQHILATSALLRP